jgi:hypothetical protein
MKTSKLPKITITDEAKIITLVCYLLENIGSLTEEQLIETVTVDEIVPQFKLTDALTTIEKKGLATLSDKVYKITKSGQAWLSEFENTLAVTLRNKLLSEGKEVVRLFDIRKTVRWGVSKNDSSWVFHACLLNEIDGTPVMEIKIYSKTEAGVVRAQEKFLKDPAKALGDSINNFI